MTRSIGLRGLQLIRFIPSVGGTGCWQLRGCSGNSLQLIRFIPSVGEFEKVTSVRVTKVFTTNPIYPIGRGMALLAQTLRAETGLQLIRFIPSVGGGQKSSQTWWEPSNGLQLIRFIPSVGVSALLNWVLILIMFTTNPIYPIGRGPSGFVFSEMLMKVCLQLIRFIPSVGVVQLS